MAKRKPTLRETTTRQRVIDIVQSFEGATATPVLQHLKLQFGKKLIGWYMENHHGNGRVELQIRGLHGRSQQLVEEDPAVYFIPSYHGKKGNIGIWLDVPTREAPSVDWDQIAQLLLEAYGMVNPDAVLTRKRVPPGAPRKRKPT